MTDIAPEAVEEQPVIDEPTETEDGEQPTAPEPGPEGFPPNTPVADMAPEQQAAYWRTQARKHEKTAKAYGDYKPDQVKAMASRIAEIEDAQKTEEQRLAERAAAAEERALKAEIAMARLTAAATHNVPASLLDALGGKSEEEVYAAAEAISKEFEAAVAAEVDKRMAAMPPPPAPEPTPEPPYRGRPVESLTPGGMPSPEDHLVDGNAFLRRMAGRPG